MSLDNIQTGTQLPVFQISYDYVQSRPSNFWKFYRNVNDCKPSFASDPLINTQNEAYNNERVAPLSIFLIDIGSPFFKFSTPFPYTTIISIKFSPYTLLILLWILGTISHSAYRKRITLCNSHLAATSTVP